MMFVNKYKISDERQITITFLLIIPCWRTFYVSANNNLLVLFVADININVRQPSAEMSRLIEFATVNPFWPTCFQTRFLWLYMSSSIHFVSQQTRHSEQQRQYPRDKTALFRDSAAFFERRGGEKWAVKERSFRFTLDGSCSLLDIQTAVENNGSYVLLHGMYVLCLTSANGMNG